jgi:hypothetical protein
LSGGFISTIGKKTLASGRWQAPLENNYSQSEKIAVASFEKRRRFIAAMKSSPSEQGIWP